MFTFSTLFSPNQFPPAPQQGIQPIRQGKRSKQQLLHSTDNRCQSHAVCTFKTHISYMCKPEIQLHVHLGGQLKKKTKPAELSMMMRTTSMMIWELLLLTSPLQLLLSHITVLHCHRLWERDISSAQLKAGKRAGQTAAAGCSFYIQFLQNKEDGSSWQGPFDWEAAFWCPGSQPGNWISAHSLINVLQNILPPTVLRWVHKVSERLPDSLQAREQAHFAAPRWVGFSPLLLREGEERRGGGGRILQCSESS